MTRGVAPERVVLTAVVAHGADVIEQPSGGADGVPGGFNHFKLECTHYVSSSCLRCWMHRAPNWDTPTNGWLVTQVTANRLDASA